MLPSLPFVILRGASPASRVLCISSSQLGCKMSLPRSKVARRKDCAYRIGRVAPEDESPQRPDEVGAGDAQCSAVRPQQTRVAADQQPQRRDRRVSGLQVTCGSTFSA